MEDCAARFSFCNQWKASELERSGQRVANSINTTSKGGGAIRRSHGLVIGTA